MLRIRYLLGLAAGGLAVVALVGVWAGVGSRVVVFATTSAALVLGLVLLAWIDLRRGVRAAADRAVAHVGDHDDHLVTVLGWERNKIIQRLERSLDWQLHQQASLLALYRRIDGEPPVPPVRQMAASPDLLYELTERVRHGRPTSVLECGSGVSTLAVAYALRENEHGRVVALEHLDVYAEATRRMLGEHGLEDWAEVRHAPLEDVDIADETWSWYRLDDVPEGPFDLVVVDGPPSTVGRHARYPAGPLLAHRLSDGGVLLLDDLDRPDEQEIADRWQSELDGLAFRSIPLRRGGGEFRRVVR